MRLLTHMCPGPKRLEDLAGRAAVRSSAESQQAELRAQRRARLAQAIAPRVEALLHHVDGLRWVGHRLVDLVEPVPSIAEPLRIALHQPRCGADDERFVVLITSVSLTADTSADGYQVLWGVGRGPIAGEGRRARTTFWRLP